VSLRSVSICVVDDKGEVCLEAKVAAEIDAIVDRLRRFSSEVKSVGFEAGTLTQYLTYGLQAAGFEVICLEARQVSVTLAAMRNKTDRNDARGLAQILRTGWYSRVHVKSLHSHEVRALLASRKAILKKCVDLENELRGLLKVFGIRLPSRVGHGSFDAELRETVSSDEMLACALVPLLMRNTLSWTAICKGSSFPVDSIAKKIAEREESKQAVIPTEHLAQVIAGFLKLNQCRLLRREGIPGQQRRQDGLVPRQRERVGVR